MIFRICDLNLHCSIYWWNCFSSPINF